VTAVIPAAAAATIPFDVELRGVTKIYGARRAGRAAGVTKAVDNFSLTVPRGSFTTLLGPSGCGKTTLLRIIAGFLTPDAGTVLIAGEDQKDTPPERRRTGIVFQDYALFPHLTAGENLAYGLRVRRVGAVERAARVGRIAGALGLGDLLARYPEELSGGQQQRLALGRALILEPRVLLMDEPLSNLDAKLRFRVRDELKDLQKRLGITTIYVTHDQEEALMMSDHVAVMNNGRLEQAGTPVDLYERPRTAFTADFTGPANIVTVSGRLLLVRPEWAEANAAGGGVDAAGGAGGPLRIPGRVVGTDYLGAVTRARVEPDDAGLAKVLVVNGGVGGAAPGTRVVVTARRAWALEEDGRSGLG